MIAYNNYLVVFSDVSITLIEFAVVFITIIIIVIMLLCYIRYQLITTLTIILYVTKYLHFTNHNNN